MLYYPHNIGDFSAATAGLDLESVGIFVRLVDRFMLTEKPIKTQWVSVGFPKESHEKVFAILDGLFERSEDGWIYPPLAEEVERYRRTVEKNRENGRKGGRPRKDASSETPVVQASLVVTESPADEENPKKTTGNPVGGLTNNQQPTTNIEEANASSKKTRKRASEYDRASYLGLEGVSDELWADWTKHRKRKRAVVTQLVIDTLAKEASRAGLSVAQAMTIQIERGWTGFRADWVVKPVQNTSFKRSLQREDMDYTDDF